MVQKIVELLGFSLLSCILYRLGGSEGFNTKVRDCGVPTLFALYLGRLGAFTGILGWVCLPLMLLAMFGALTTYHYFLPKPKDYTWWHYSLHGFMIGLSAIFYAMATGHYFWFSLRTIFLSLFMGAWYFVAVRKDWLNEGGRGFIIVFSSPLLLI